MTTRILYICTGNATRSFLAEVYTRRTHPQFVVASAGTLVIEGTVTSRRTRAAFDELGLEVPPHTSRQVTGAMLDDADTIIGFEQIHADFIARLHPEHAPRVVIVDVPDPEGSDEQAFRATARAIATGLDELLDRLAESP